MQIRGYLSLLVLCAATCGCSFVDNFYKSSKAEVILESSDGLPGSEHMPFTLKVLQEFNDGKELHIVGSVIANTEWDSNSVILRLTSLNNGVSVGVIHHTLRSLIEARIGKGASPTIAGGQEATFSLAVPSQGMSDYQLVLLWGDEADAFLGKKTANRPQALTGNEKVPASDLKLRVHSIEIETLQASCPYPPCEVRFRLKAMFQNQGKGVIASAKLGIGFVPVENFGSQTLPEAEEMVDVDKLDLRPGQSRPFRILLNQEMSVEVAEEVRPVLRILSFEGE